MSTPAQEKSAAPAPGTCWRLKGFPKCHVRVTESRVAMLVRPAIVMYRAHGPKRHQHLGAEGGEWLSKFLGRMEPCPEHRTEKKGEV